MYTRPPWTTRKPEGLGYKRRGVWELLTFFRIFDLEALAVLLIGVFRLIYHAVLLQSSRGNYALISEAVLLQSSRGNHAKMGNCFKKLWGFPLGETSKNTLKSTQIAQSCLIPHTLNGIRKFCAFCVLFDVFFDVKYAPRLPAAARALQLVMYTLIHLCTNNVYIN